MLSSSFLAACLCLWVDVALPPAQKHFPHQHQLLQLPISWLSVTDCSAPCI